MQTFVIVEASKYHKTNPEMLSTMCVWLLIDKTFNEYITNYYFHEYIIKCNYATRYPPLYDFHI